MRLPRPVLGPRHQLESARNLEYRASEPPYRSPREDLLIATSLILAHAPHSHATHAGAIDHHLHHHLHHFHALLHHLR